MDRGQEIEFAANAAIDGLCSLEGFDKTDMCNMFASGVTWADAHPKETNGCKYCMGEIKQEYKMVGYSRKGRPKYENVDVRKPIDFGDSCKMTISANLLRMDYDAYSCDSSFLNEILINYCPFCGRRLK